jgi:hypothetical protein
MTQFFRVAKNCVIIRRFGEYPPEGSGSPTVALRATSRGPHGDGDGEQGCTFG